jgi:hypothetical protein
MSLAKAIIYGDKQAVLGLLVRGADVNEIDEYGFRPLVQAAIMEKTDVAELLLDYGADVDQEDGTGRTALHWAVENHNLPLCKLLLTHKANPNFSNVANQPMLIYPILRGQKELKNLLYQYGAHLNFALDYINTKLLGHRYELIGQVDIVNASESFVEIDFEGFFLEFTIDIILSSLKRFTSHFTARHLRSFKPYTTRLIQAFETAAELIRYQHYTTDLFAHERKIETRMRENPLIIPVANRGHAMAFIKCYNILAKCDRGMNSAQEGSVNLYRIHQLERFNPDFFKQMIYVKQSRQFMDEGFKRLLKTEPFMRLPLSSQVTGNCSWANMEAIVPTILFLLMAQEVPENSPAIRDCIDKAWFFHEQWSTWDQDRELESCIQSFYAASPARKASKAAVLGAILFQRSHIIDQKSLARAEKILRILVIPDYRYVLESYIEVYWRRKRTQVGKNLVDLLDLCGVPL